MEIGTSNCFLVLQRENGLLGHKIKIVVSQHDALFEWNPSTRISPIFGVSEFQTAEPKQVEFKGTHYLIFLGPIHPEKLFDCCHKGTRLWLSLGLFNVLISTRSVAERNRVMRWAEKTQGCHYEAWTVRNGRFQERDIRSSIQLPSNGAWRDQLGKLYGLTLDPELTRAVKEYIPLMASAMSRSEPQNPALYSDLQDINNFVVTSLEKFRETVSIAASPYAVFGQLVLINSGLARLTYQTFSGISKIKETECHLRSNSLMGIGVATLALWQICFFLRSVLGAARLNDRFAGLKDISRDVPDLCELPPTDRFWSEDHLGKVIPPAEGYRPQVPLVPYFSARDGFRGALTTVSAPLAALSACNSIRWSLLTMTHEISHIWIRDILAQLYGDLESNENLQSALELLKSNGRGDTLFEEIRRLLLIGIELIDKCATNRTGTVDYDQERLKNLLERRRREVEEIMVHVFDFLYFYGNAEKYVKGIWLSWGTIPNINTRIQEYVLRTLSAVLSKHLREPHAEEITRDEVCRYLKPLENKNEYVRLAIKHIEVHWDQIKRQLFARKQIVKIVRTFLFSEAAAKTLRKETSVGAKRKGKMGYALSPGIIELKTISNPLLFIDAFTSLKEPSPSISAWIFYVLAFCVYIDG